MNKPYKNISRAFIYSIFNISKAKSVSLAGEQAVHVPAEPGQTEVVEKEVPQMSDLREHDGHSAPRDHESRDGAGHFDVENGGCQIYVPEDARRNEEYSLHCGQCEHGHGCIHFLAGNPLTSGGSRCRCGLQMLSGSGDVENAECQVDGDCHSND